MKRLLGGKVRSESPTKGPSVASLNPTRTSVLANSEYFITVRPVAAIERSVLIWELLGPPIRFYRQRRKHREIVENLQPSGDVSSSENASTSKDIEYYFSAVMGN